jgi:hypothetical protein
MGADGFDLTEEEREAAQYLAETDNPLAPVARLMLYSDSAASSMDSASSPSTTAYN